MDHKWGRNVLEFGCGDFGATLCSRFPGPPGPIIGITNVTVGNSAYWFTIPLNPDLPMTFQLVGKLPGHPHFPYGWAVEPDAPV